MIVNVILICGLDHRGAGAATMAADHFYPVAETSGIHREKKPRESPNLDFARA